MTTIKVTVTFECDEEQPSQTNLNRLEDAIKGALEDVQDNQPWFGPYSDYTATLEDVSVADVL